MPMVMRCYNGPDYISHEFTTWAGKLEIRIEYIQPGKPVAERIHREGEPYNLE